MLGQNSKLKLGMTEQSLKKLSTYCERESTSTLQGEPLMMRTSFKIFSSLIHNLATCCTSSHTSSSSTAHRGRMHTFLFVTNPLLKKREGQQLTYMIVQVRDPFLCEFIGFTCTGKNFVIAIYFMSHENTDTYIWALQQLQYLLRGTQPNVFVTDR